MADPINNNNTSVPLFGSYGSNSVSYPNDTVQLDIYNAANQYIETNYRVASFTKSASNVTFDPEKDLTDLGYISGRYKVEYKFNRNLLGSGDTHKLYIQEVSADGLEIRVVPVNSTTLSNTNFLSFFEQGFFSLPKKQTLTNLFLYKNANTQLRVFDYVQDKFTYSTTPYSIIFKLSSPAPASIVIGDLLWLTQQVSDSFTDNITIIPPKRKPTQVQIAGPNWDAVDMSRSGASDSYKDWDDLLSTNTQTSQDIVNRLLSGSLVEGINLNIDYKKFDNFIHFGSATERLHNFRYKLQLLESYTARIEDLTTNLTGLVSSSVTGSTYFQSNIVDAKTKRSALLGSFDGYEKYLYYNSSSYETSSYGEFYPSTWPKINNAKPYVNYSTTSSQAEDWFDGILTSASLFDQNNPNSLQKLIPSHVQLDTNNGDYVLFVNMIGHYYDLIFGYVKGLSDLTDRQQSIFEGFSKDLIYHVSKNLGLDFENGNTLEDLWSYVLGTDATGSVNSNYGTTLEDKTKEVWKRIVNNLPYLLKTKGTDRGLRALINCFGIPQTILRIREYGGAEPEFTTKTDFVHERFNYALQVGYGGYEAPNLYAVGSYGTASYSYVDPTETLSIPWQTLSENNQYPNSTQIRAKMVKNFYNEQRIMEVPNQWQIKAFKSGSGDYLGFFLNGTNGWLTASVSSSIYDGTFHSITLRREVEDDTASIQQQYTLVVKKTKYEKVVSTQTASISIDGALSASYNTSYTTPGTLWIPGSSSYTFAQSESITLLSGSVQEFRYWTTALRDNILDNHALAPTSYQGNNVDIFTGSTSSFYDLAFRLCLGSDNKKINYQATTSYNSQHPNQDINTFYSGTPKSALFVGLREPMYEPIVEIHSTEWPDLGGNRSLSNKIRIDESVLVGDSILYRNVKVERPLSDNFPVESSRLGVFLSPVNEYNQDIAEQFGGLSIDDYIGDPAHRNSDYYPELEKLQVEYGKKFRARNNPQNYIRLLQHFDSSLFNLIKSFVPYRANLQTGLVIESDILHRSKVATLTRNPSTEDLQYTASIIIPENTATVGGAMLDGDGDPFRVSTGYVPEAVIKSNLDFLFVGGEEQAISIAGQEPAGLQMVEDLLAPQAYDMTILAGTTLTTLAGLTGVAKEFNNTQIYDGLTGGDSLTSPINTRLANYGRDLVAQGSQYIFMTYATSGSGVSQSANYMITSSRYDYYEPLSPIIMGSRISEIANLTNNIYDIDLYGSKAFTNAKSYHSSSNTAYKTIYSSSAAIFENYWTSDYGMRIQHLYDGNYGSSVSFNSTYYWSLSGSYGLQFYNEAENFIVSRVQLPAFFYKQDNPLSYNRLYKIDIEFDANYSSYNFTEPYFDIYFGDAGSSLSASLVYPGITDKVSYITKATGPWLVFDLTTDFIAPGSVSIKSLSIQCLNYRAEVQDFHLQDSYGMRNARYNGCKMSSADFNIDSPDTVDRGPVVQVTVGGGTQLTIDPGIDGNFQIV